MPDDYKSTKNLTSIALSNAIKQQQKIILSQFGSKAAYKEYIAQLNLLQRHYAGLHFPVRQEKIYEQTGYVGSFNPSAMKYIRDEILLLMENISVHENYVSFPETLIPDGFSCREIEAPEGVQNLKAPDIPSKKLSCSDAIAILSILIASIIGILSYQSSQQSSEKQYELQLESNELQREQLRAEKEQARIMREQTQILEDIIAHLDDIYKALQAGGTVPLEGDSALSEDDLGPDDARIQTALPHLYPNSAPESRPTVSDESNSPEPKTGLE